MSFNTWGDVYDEWLDGLGEGCQLCKSYGHARILKEVDPIAYRCGFADWTDTLRETEFACEDCGTMITVDSDVCADDDYNPLCEDCAKDDDE